MTGIRPQPQPNARPMPITMASLLFYIIGVISLAATSYILAFFIRTHTFPSFLGVQMFMSGRFEGPSFARLIALVSLVLAALVLEIVAANWLWRSVRKGGYLTLVLLAIGLLVTIALGAPGILIPGLLATILVLSRWGSLR